MDVKVYVVVDIPEIEGILNYVAGDLYDDLGIDSNVKRSIYLKVTKLLAVRMLNLPDDIEEEASILESLLRALERHLDKILTTIADVGYAYILDSISVLDNSLTLRKYPIWQCSQLYLT